MTCPHSGGTVNLDNGTIICRCGVNLSKRNVRCPFCFKQADIFGELKGKVRLTCGCRNVPAEKLR